MRPNPERSVTRCDACGQHGQDEFHVPASQRIQGYIDRIVLALISLEEWPPECPDRLVTGLVIKAEGYITIPRAAFAVDDRAEPVPSLYTERWEETLNISVLNILWEREDTRTCIGSSRFEPGIADLQHKTFGIAIRPGALIGRDLPCACVPSCRTGIGGEIIGHIRCRCHCGAARSHRWAAGSDCGS